MIMTCVNCGMDFVREDRRGIQYRELHEVCDLCTTKQLVGKLIDKAIDAAAAAWESVPFSQQGKTGFERAAHLAKIIHKHLTPILTITAEDGFTLPLNEYEPDRFVTIGRLYDEIVQLNKEKE